MLDYRKSETLGLGLEEVASVHSELGWCPASVPEEPWPAVAPLCGEISAHTAVPAGAVMSSCPRRAGVLDPVWLSGSAEMQNTQGMAPQAIETLPDVHDLG